MASRESHDKEEAARLLTRELRSKQNARFLRGLPAFQLRDGLPDKMQGLLDQLEQTERTYGGGNQAGALGAAHGHER